MKNKFRFLTFALVASLVALTSCNTDDDEIKPTTPPVEQPELSYTFEDVASWEPQTIAVGYEEDAYEIYAGVYASQTNRSFFEAIELLDSDDIADWEQLKNSFMLIYPGREGEHNLVSFVNGEPEDTEIVLYHFSGSTQIMGQTIPMVWISENMTVSVTKFDMANQKVSLTVTATMRDIVSLMMGATGNDPGAKTFTLTVKNYPMANWGVEDLAKLAAKMKKAK